MQSNMKLVDDIDINGANKYSDIILEICLKLQNILLGYVQQQVIMA